MNSQTEARRPGFAIVINESLVAMEGLIKQQGTLRPERAFENAAERAAIQAQIDAYARVVIDFFPSSPQMSLDWEKYLFSRVPGSTIARVTDEIHRARSRREQERRLAEAQPASPGS